jgi:hypothetical protein
LLFLIELETSLFFAGVRHDSEGGEAARRHLLRRRVRLSLARRAAACAPALIVPVPPLAMGTVEQCRFLWRLLVLRVSGPVLQKFAGGVSDAQTTLDPVSYVHST